MIPLVTYHPCQKKNADLLVAALQQEFPHHVFEAREGEGGLYVVLLPSPDGRYTDAVQWYAIGFKDRDVGRE
jgi:hypothetical protein